jgi:hypothetical protein
MSAEESEPGKIELSTFKPTEPSITKQSLSSDLRIGNSFSTRGNVVKNGTQLGKPKQTGVVP